MNMGFTDNYIDSILMPNEKVILKARIHWMMYFYPFLLTVFLVVEAATGNALPLGQEISFFAAALFYWGYCWLRRRSTELALTDRRIIAKFGIISRKTFEIDLNKVEGINFKQSIFGRMLGYASVICKGTGGNYAPIPNISNYFEFKKAYQNLREQGKGT